MLFLYALFACFLCALVPVCEAMKVENELLSISSSQHFQIVWDFEFDKGGQMDFRSELVASNKIANTSLQLIFCSEEQMQPLENVRVQDVCISETFDTVECIWQGQFGVSYDTVGAFNYTIPERGWYKLLQLNCDTIDWEVQLDYVAVNPGGEYLSLSDVPFKLTFLTSAGAWLLVALVWVCFWCPYRHFNVKLQRLFTLVPLIKTVSSLMWCWMWTHASVLGTRNEYLNIGAYITCSLDHGITMVVLILAALGWHITRGRLSDLEFKRLFTIGAMVSLSFFLYLLLDGFFVFLLVIVFIFTVRTVFVCIIENTQKLLMQMELMRGMQLPQSANSPCLIKLGIFKRFQIIMVMFISVDLIMYLWASIFLVEQPWISEALQAGMMIMMTGAVCHAFRMRPFNPYFMQISNNPGAPPTAATGLQNFNNSSSTTAFNEPLMEGNLEWRPGMAVPNIPSDPSYWLASEDNSNEPLILVSYPKQQNGQQHMEIAVKSSSGARSAIFPQQV